jgi:cytoskeletal protein CcmA (bactofilin family)
VNAGGKWEVEMFKSKTLEKEKDTAAKVTEVVASTVQQQHSVVEQPSPRREPTTNAATSSCIGSGMSIVGNIECNGPAQVFGRIKGELRASDLVIGDGAQIEGSVIAQDVTICGRVKGTIRAVRVKLQDGGAVEGDIFHRSLSIDEKTTMPTSKFRRLFVKRILVGPFPASRTSISHSRNSKHWCEIVGLTGTQRWRT